MRQDKHNQNQGRFISNMGLDRVMDAFSELSQVAQWAEQALSTRKELQSPGI